MRNCLFLMPILGLLSAHAVAASSFTNGLKGLFNNVQDPVICIKNDTHVKVDGKVVPLAVLPGQSVSAATLAEYSGNQYYAGAEIREGGCDEQQNAYFGYMGISLSGSVSYKAPGGSHIALISPTVSDDGVIHGTLGYSKIGQPNSLPQNKDNRQNWYTGFNLSGLEFSYSPNGAVFPNISDADKSTSDSDEAAVKTSFEAGANTVRVPVRWAYLQPYGVDSTYFDSRYFDNIVAPLLVGITSHDDYAIVDLHSYMHYSKIGSQVAGCYANSPCPDGTLVTDSAPYVRIWSELYEHMKATTGIKMDHIMIDIVNEPATKGKENLTAKDVFDMEVAVMQKLNSLGFTGKYLVEGPSWSGLHSWTASGAAAQFTEENFKAKGINPDQVIINVHQYLDNRDFSGTGTSCQPDLTTTGPTGYNLNAFVDYLRANQLKAIVTEFGVGSDQATCTKAMTGFLDYLKEYAYPDSIANGGTGNDGFVGWTVWSVGHGWGAYNLRVKPGDKDQKIPGDYKFNILKDYFKS